MLAAGAGLGLFAQQVLKHGGHRIERGNRGQGQRAASFLQPVSQLGINQSEQHQTRMRRNFAQHAVHVLLAADHRPEVSRDLGIVELGKRGLGDHLQRFAGGIRQKMDVNLGHESSRAALWTDGGINHGTRLVTTWPIGEGPDSHPLPAWETDSCGQVDNDSHRLGTGGISPA